MIRVMIPCLWCDAERKTSRSLEPGHSRECPECDHVFKGHGWDGIDAHWKAKHAGTVMPYEGFWEGISNCRRHRAQLQSTPLSLTCLCRFIGNPDDRCGRYFTQAR